jgi:hypothetical protein
MDETLVSSLYASNENHADQLLDIYGQYWTGVKFSLSNDGWYASFIRSWSKELIEYLQLTLGLDNVCILSWGSQRYVLEVVKLLGLNIPPCNIYTREDMRYTAPRFKDRNIVLVDDESHWYHMQGDVNKVNFLYGLKPEKLIQVTKFDVRYFREGLDISIEELIKKIEEAYETKI